MTNQIVQLKSGNNNLYPIGANLVPDFNNVLATLSASGSNYSSTYTATEKCFFIEIRAGAQRINEHSDIVGTFLLDVGDTCAGWGRGHNGTYFVVGVKYI